MVFWPQMFWLMLIPAVVVVAGAWPLAKWLTRQSVVDQPDPSRRLHQTVTPRGGGLVILLGLVLAVALQSFYGTAMGFVIVITVYAGALSLLGFWEDWQPRPVKPRLLAQCVLGIGVIWAVGPIDTVMLQMNPWSSPWLWSLLAWVGLVWLMNLHNFMDGADGLAASQGVWTAMCYALVFYQDAQLPWMWLSLSMAGAYLGFLVWNRPIARVFMGDSGSLLLGGMVGLLAYQAIQSQAATLVVCLMISSVFVVDATATLIRRVLRGERWYTAHATHAFQRLIAGGLSHSQVLTIYVLLNVGLVMPFTYSAARYPSHEGWIGMALLSTLCVGWWRVQKTHLNQG